MMQGYAFVWTEMVSDLLVKRENGLEYTGLTDYFRLLDEYLDNQLDPTGENTFEEYVDPPTEAQSENEIVDENNESKEIDNEETNKDKLPKAHEDINENIIETDEDSHSKSGGEASTVGVLEIKNPVAASDEDENIDPKEAAYNVYWWIGIAVAIAVVVVLVAIVARKRHNHRKQLERQRQQNSCA